MLWKCLGRLSKISLNWRNWLRKNEAKKFHNSTLQYSENHWSKFVLMESSEFTWKNCRILSSFFTSCSMMNLCLPAVTKAETFQSLNLSTICKMWNRIDKYSPRRRWIKTIAISSLKFDLSVIFQYSYFALPPIDFVNFVESVKSWFFNEFFIKWVW